MSSTAVSILLILLFCLMAVLMYKEDALLRVNCSLLSCGYIDKQHLDSIQVRQERMWSHSHCRDRISKWQFNWLVFLIFVGVILCAFRDVQNTYDTANYIAWFSSWNVSSLSDFFKFGGETEVGFEFISRIIKLFSFGNVPVYLGSIALISLSLFAAAIWKLTDRRLTVFMLLYFIFGFYYSYIVIRQGIAMAIILYTIACIYKNDRLYVIRFLCGIAVAMLFHRASVICIAMLPFLRGRVRIKRPMLVFIFIISLVLVSSRNTVLIVAKLILKVSELQIFSFAREKIYAYFSTIEVDTSSKFRAMFIMLFLITWLKNAQISNKKSWNIFIGIECFGVLLVGFLSGSGVVLRFGQFFFIAQCFLLPELTSCIGRKGNKILLSMITLFYLYVMMGYSGI